MLVETRLVAICGAHLKATDELLEESLPQPRSSRVFPSCFQELPEVLLLPGAVFLLLLPGAVRKSYLAASLSCHAASLPAFVSSLAHHPAGP